MLAHILQVLKVLYVFFLLLDLLFNQVLLADLLTELSIFIIVAFDLFNIDAHLIKELSVLELLNGFVFLPSTIDSFDVFVVILIIVWIFERLLFYKV